MPDDFDSTGLFSDPGEPDSSLPGVRHTGGFMPNQSQMVEEMLQRSGGNQLATHVLLHGSRGRALAGMAAVGLAGSNASQWMHSDPGRLAQLTMSGLINSQLLNGYTGGSDLDMAFGVQNALGRGTRLNVNGSSQMASGRGFVNDLMSQHFFDHLQDKFYGPLGAARLQRTAGYDRGDVGAVFSGLGERGAFVGDTMGALHKKDDGTYRYQIDDKAASRVEDLATRALKTIRALQNITGNKNVRETMQLAEKITGGDFVADPEMIKSQLNHITRTAQLTGLNPQALMQHAMALGGGPAAIAGVTAAASTYQAAQEQRKDLLAQGIYTAAPNLQEVETVNTLGIKGVQNDEKEAMAALYVSEHYGLKDDQKSEIKKRINAIAAGTTRDQKAAARAELRQYTEKLTGGVALHNIYDQQGGAEGINKGLSAETQTFGTQFAQKEDMSRLFDINLRDMASVTHLDQIAGTQAGGMATAMSQIFKKMDRKTETETIAALQTGDWEKAKAAFSKSAGFASDADREKAWNQIRSVAGADAKKFGNALGIARDSMANNPMMRNRHSAGDDELAQAQINRRKMEERRFGTGVAETDLLESIGRGFAGGENISDVKILQDAENRNDPAMLKLQLNDKGTSLVGDLPKWQVEQLEKMKGLKDALGGGDINAALHTAKGVSAMTDYFDKHNYIWQTGTDNKIRAMNPEAAAAGEARLSAEADSMLIKSITGGSDADVAEMSKDPTKFGTALSNNSDKIISGLADPNSKEGQNDRALATQHHDLYLGTLDAMINKRQEAVNYQKEHPILAHLFGSPENQDEQGRDFHFNRATKELDALKKEKTRLGVEGQDGDMIGRVRMVLGDDVVMDLFKSRGLST